LSIIDLKNIARKEMPTEAQTRRELIDPRLLAAGWGVAPFNPGQYLSALDGVALTEFPTENGPADYALVVSGKVVGIVEAKKLSLGPQNVLTQAERYARGLLDSTFNFNGLRAPFLYSTNGEVIWFHDVRHPLTRSRKIAGFHTPAALQEMLGRDFEADCQGLLSTPNSHHRLRPYQREANEAMEQAIAARKREMLVAMATGTGKTFTMVNEIYRLMKAGVAKRVLFLVDRRALAAQAVRAFASFDPEPNQKFTQIYEVYSQRFFRDDLDEDEKFDPQMLPSSYLLTPNPGHAFVYVCTIQRMTINLFGRNAVFALGDEEVDEDAARLDIPIHAFDLIVPDECHRGYTASEEAVWRDTLNHFDAVKIGLTATPAAHTTTYFKEIAYRYEFSRAVREGYLVDYDAVSIQSDVRMNGVFLDEGERVGLVDPETGRERLDHLEDEREFASTEVEEKVTSPDSNRKILEEIKKYADEHQAQFGRFPKTLIFAANDLPHTSHADHLVDIARDIFGQGDSFVQKITGRVDRPLQRIREFRNRKQPNVVVTVDLLSTGVDIPDLEFIVFLRVVKSRILFEQMMGRGTRRGELYPDKSHFTVFDCFGGTLLEYFRKATAITVEPPQKEARTLHEIIEEIWANRDRDYNTRCLVKRLQRVAKEMSGDAHALFSPFMEEGDVARFAAGLPERLRKDFTGVMTILRNPDLQALLVNYPRPPRTFLVAYSTVDTVTSEWKVRGKDGVYIKPEDYLTAFTRYVNENKDQVEALTILLERPKEWGTNALLDLRKRLTTSPEGFTESNLQKAHEQCYHKALADIISMVKHAARDTEQLLTGEERADLAIQRATQGLYLTTEQQQWLDWIEAHLAVNLSIEKDDFDLSPILTRHGGWGQANRAFQGQLEGLIQKLNEAVAA
jgi:type I restriction enzyme R subunit